MNKFSIKIIFFSLVVILLFCLSACNFNGFFNKQNNINENFTEATFSLKILEKINDGEKIYILGEASSSQKFPVSLVLLKLGLMGQNGDIINEETYKFANLMGKDKSEFFEKNEPKKFLIVIDSTLYTFNNPTDFQLELSWGNNNILAQNTEANLTNNVIGENNKIEVNSNITTPSNINRSEAFKMVNLQFEKKIAKVNAKDPQYYFVITGEFENLSDKVINDISLAVSFKSKLSDNKLNNEDEFLDIKSVGLNPKSSKKFEMELETILNSQDANIYKPVIKIVSFN